MRKRSSPVIYLYLSPSGYTISSNSAKSRMLFHFSHLNWRFCLALTTLLDEATNPERRRLAELLVERVTLFQDRMELEIKAGGLKTLKEQVENESQN